MRSRRNVVRMGEPLRRPAARHRGLTEPLALAAFGAVLPGLLLGWFLSAGLAAGLPLWQLLGVAVVLLLIAAGPAVWTARRTARRIAELARALRRLGRGEFEVVMPLDDQDEIDDLAGEFNLAAKRLSDRDLEREREIMDREREIARLRADLRMNLTDLDFLAERTNRAAELRGFGERVRDSRDATEVARRLNEALRLFDFDEAYVLMWDEEQRELRYIGAVNRERGINAVGRQVAHALLPDTAGESWLPRKAVGRGRTLRDTAAAEGRTLAVLHEIAFPINAGGRTQAVLWVRVLSRPLSEEDEQDIAFMVKAAGDALENVRLFQEAAQVEALRALDRMKSELISTVSHELRTPLVSIKGYAETLLTDTSVDEATRREFLSDIIDEGDRLAELINNLLDMSRIEAGMLRIQPQAVPLQKLAARVVAKLRARANMSGHKLELNLPPDLPAVQADGPRIEQVLRNLIENAIKYSPDGGRILVYAEPKADQIVVSVRDHGIGLSAEHAERIFDRFYRVDSSLTRGTSGTGIGLSICRGLVEAHSGRIWVESVPETGSTFHFSLPVARALHDEHELVRAAD